MFEDALTFQNISNYFQVILHRRLNCVVPSGQVPQGDRKGLAPFHCRHVGHDPSTQDASNLECLTVCGQSIMLVDVGAVPYFSSYIFELSLLLSSSPISLSCHVGENISTYTFISYTFFTYSPLSIGCLSLEHPGMRSPAVPIQ